jgi:hypothetical protein
MSDAAHDAGELGKYKDGAIKVQIVDKDALHLITPEALAAFAVRNGWAHVGAYGQFGEIYEGQDRPLILLPCVSSIGDYAVRVSQGIVSFEAATGRDQLSIYAELTTHDECPNAGTGS